MKKSMKKGLALLTTTALLAGTLAACGKDEEKPTAGKGDSSSKFSGTLDVAVFEGGFGTKFWEEAEKQFEELYPDVDVVLNASPNIGDVVRPKIAAGDPPDFIYHSAQNAKSVAKALIKDKNLVDLTDVFSKPAPGEKTPIKEKMLDGFLETSGAAPYGDGKVYLAPLYYNLTGLWYNKALFAEKGWEVPKTVDQFLALGKEAKKEGKALFTYQGQSPAYLEAVIWPLIASNGGAEAVSNIFTYGEGAWDNEAVTGALKLFEDLGKSGDVLKGTVAMNHIQSQTEHLKGSALFAPNGNWYEGEMKDAVQDGWEWGFMAPPVTNESDDQYVTTMIEEMYIPGQSDNIETAKEFMRFLYSDGMIELNSKESGAVIPVKNGVEIAKPYIPASNYDSFKIFDQGVKPIIVAWETVANSEINMNDEVYTKVGSVVNGETTAAEWAKSLEKSSEKVRKVKE